MIVLPMAGLSSRFVKAGFEKPKYMLRIGGRSVLAHVVQSFENLFGRERFLFVCRDIAGTPGFIEREMSRLGLAPETYQIAVLDEPTSGQAETVALGLQRAGVDPAEQLTVFNIDTFRPGFSYPEDFDLAEVDGYLEVFRGPGEHWSFVRPSHPGDQTARSGHVAEVTEKNRISDLCSTGLYYFRSVGMFLDIYKMTLSTDPRALPGGERYVAPLYQLALQNGADIRYQEIDPEDVIFCGTPEEYAAAKDRLMSDIAICISGQIRGPHEHLVRVAQYAEDLGADVFISTWSERGRKTLSGATALHQLHRLLGPECKLAIPVEFYNKMDALFPDIQTEISSARVPVENEIRELFPKATLDIEQPNLFLDFEGEVRDHNSLRMLYLIWRCNRLKRLAEKTRNRRYRHVIRMRPDVLPNIEEFVDRSDEIRTVVFPGARGSSVQNQLGDIYWMCDSEQDDAICLLFAKALQEPHRPWNNIHIEIYKHVVEQQLEIELARPLAWIQDDSSVDEQTALARAISDVLRAGALSGETGFSKDEQRVIGEAIAEFGDSHEAESDIEALAANIETTQTLSGLRALAVAILANIPIAAVAERCAVLAVLFAIAARQRDVQDPTEIDRSFFQIYEAGVRSGAQAASVGQPAEMVAGVARALADRLGEIAGAEASQTVLKSSAELLDGWAQPRKSA